MQYNLLTHVTTRSTDFNKMTLLKFVKGVRGIGKFRSIVISHECKELARVDWEGYARKAKKLDDSQTFHMKFNDGFTGQVLELHWNAATADLLGKYTCEISADAGNFSEMIHVRETERLAGWNQFPTVDPLDL